jgi:hypothetical protein
MPLLKRSRGQALLHYFLALEVEAVLAGSGQTIFAVHRRTVESSFRAVPAIYSHCSIRHEEPLEVSDELFGEAREFLQFAWAYEQIEYSMRLVDKGQMHVFVARHEPRITFAYSSAEADARDTLLRSGEISRKLASPESSVQAAPVSSLKSVLERVGAELDRLTVRTGPEEIKYTYDESLLTEMREWARHLLPGLDVEMPGHVSVGGSSFDEMRRLWAALLALSNTHQLAHILACRGNIRQCPVRSLVLAHSRSEWVNLLSRLSDLPAERAEAILEWYIFDAAVTRKTPPLQPFFEIGRDLLAVSWPMLYGSNFERNFLKLANLHSRLRPYLDDIGRAKEPWALRQLAALFPEPLYHSEPCVKIPGLTDADLIVYERHTGFVLLIQHKWLIEPETDDESSSNDVQLADGARQAVKARNYFRADEAALRRCLRLSESAPISEIQATVVCRGLEATGFQEQTVVPVVSERVFRSLRANSANMMVLWQSMNARPDLSESSKDFPERKIELRLAGYRFVLPFLTSA